MKQLVELKSNGAQQFEELGVEVVAVFREERDGLAGLKKIKGKTKVEFTLALDTPAKATKAYSNGRKEFDNYLVDKDGVIQGVIDGSLRSRAQAEQLVKMIKSLGESNSESKGAGMAEQMDDKAAVERSVLDYVEGIYAGKADLIQRAVHADVKLLGRGEATQMRGAMMDFAQLVDFAAKYSASGEVPKGAPKQVSVLDVSGSMASAKLESAWGTEMVHLVKEDGKWKVLQVVWQALAE